MRLINLSSQKAAFLLCSPQNYAFASKNRNKLSCAKKSKLKNCEKMHILIVCLYLAARTFKAVDTAVQLHTSQQPSQPSAQESRRTP